MKHLLQSFATTFAVQLANIASGIMAARLLLPEGRGQLAAIMLWPALIAAFGSLSVDQSVAYFAARDSDRVNVFVTSGLALAAALAAGGMIVGLFLLPVLFHGQGEATLGVAETYLLYIPLGGFGMLLGAARQGMLRFSSWNLLRLLIPVTVLLLIGLFFLFGWIDVASFAAANLLANAASVAVGAWLFYRDCRYSAAIDLAAVGQLLRYSVAIHIGLMISVLAQRLDQSVIALYLPPDELGTYVIAASVASMTTLLAGTIGALAFVKVASQPTPSAKTVLLGRYFRLTLFITLCGAVTIFILNPILVPLFYGAAFAPSIQLSRIMLLGTVPIALSTLMSAGFRAQNHTWVITYANLAGLVTAAALLFLLVPRYGVRGAAWALVAAQWAPCLVSLALSQKFTGASIAALTILTAEDIGLLRSSIATLRAVWRV